MTWSLAIWSLCLILSGSTRANTSISSKLWIFSTNLCAAGSIIHLKLVDNKFRKKTIVTKKSRSWSREGWEAAAICFRVLWPIWACHRRNPTDPTGAQVSSRRVCDQGLQWKGRSPKVENRFQKEEVDNEPLEHTACFQETSRNALRPACALCVRFGLPTPCFVFLLIRFSVSQATCCTRLAVHRVVYPQQAVKRTRNHGTSRMWSWTMNLI